MELAQSIANLIMGGVGVAATIHITLTIFSLGRRGLQL